MDLANLYQPSVKRVLWKKGDGLNVDLVEPVSSPATGQCVFVESNPEGMALYALDAGKPGPPRRLEREGHDKLIRDLAFSPDGRYLLFSSNRADTPQR